MADLNAAQFAQAVAASISGVQHLYKEVDRLLLALCEALEADPSPLAIIRSTFHRSGRDSTRMVIRNEYALLFEPRLEAEDDDEDADEDAEVADEIDEEDPELSTGRKRKRPPVQFTPFDLRLALRLALFDPKEPEGFEPYIQAAVLSEWAVGNAAPSKSGPPLVLARHMLRRIPRALGPKRDLTAGGRLTTSAMVKGTRSVERRLSCRLLDTLPSVPLFDMDGPSAVEQLAASIKTMWNSTSSLAAQT